ncbi:response regulator [Paludibacterium paludis]|uniref:Response regulatory domain-containing protein n=1 Tax=Paludibacterium paludis TaxID=1225769 RepID=A0A918NZL2_9NEIS|nr:response regulator [Paludibacterium paludis]GGY06558.1 hypothetical protein GCM10011289_06360 [Paludibacterium paludis]
MSVDFSTIRILIVDDQQLVRTLVSQALKAMGFRGDNISQAADGQTALRVLDIRQVDLVLCDVQMSRMSGVDLLKEVRCGRTSNPGTLPFVFLSGHPEKQTIVTAAKFFADGFIVKPPTPANIEKTIDGAMGRPRPEMDLFAFYHIATGTPYDKVEFPMAYVNIASEQIALEDAGEERSLAQVRPGAILARPLMSGTGILILPKGARLTQPQIHALREFQDRYGVHKVHVEPPPAEADAAADAPADPLVNQ